MILETELRFYEITDYTDKEIRDNFARLNADVYKRQTNLFMLIYPPARFVLFYE